MKRVTKELNIPRCILHDSLNWNCTKKPSLERKIVFTTGHETLLDDHVNNWLKFSIAQLGVIHKELPMMLPKS